jgi:Fe-S-cluster containining protein
VNRIEEEDSEKFGFVIETQDGVTPRLQVALSEKPVGLADMVPFMHTLADEIIGLAVKKAEARSERISCGEGCGVCCCQLVPLSAPEVLFIVKRLREMPLPERALILQRFETIEKRMEESGLKSRVCSLADADADNNAVARDYFHLGESCPFLAGHSCSIHAWRPIVCREFNVLSDPALCADPFVNKLRTVPLFRRPSSLLALLASQVAGTPAGLVPMPLMFDWYESNKELGTRTWPAEMLIKKLLEITASPPKDL